MELYNLQALNYDMFLDFYGDFPLFFTPRIPTNRLKNEDSTTPRVCLAYEIGGCIRALPGIRRMSEAEEFCFQYHYDLGTMEGMVFAVNEFSIAEDDPAIVSNWELEQKNLVPDASETGECWYLKELIADKTYFIFVDNVEDVLMGEEADAIEFNMFTDCPVSI